MCFAEGCSGRADLEQCGCTDKMFHDVRIQRGLERTMDNDGIWRYVGVWLLRWITGIYPIIALLSLCVVIAFLKDPKRFAGPALLIYFV